MARIDRQALQATFDTVLKNIPDYRRRKGKLIFGLIGVMVVCLITLLGYKYYFASKAVGADVPLVRTSIVQSSAANQGFTYSGEVRGRYESKLAFQVGGKVVRRNVDLGTVVRAGDILMEIDAKDIVQTVNIGSAQVYSAQAQLRLAESNLNRYRQLYEQNAVSQAQYDQYQNAYDAAVAAVRQASAQYVQGSNQLDYSSLYADSDGVVASVDAEAGQVVSAGQSVITLVRNGEKEIEINCPGKPH